MQGEVPSAATITDLVGGRGGEERRRAGSGVAVAVVAFEGLFHAAAR